MAQIVAETMDNYLLMGHILTCKVIPKDEVHPELWVGANRKWRAIPNARVARVKHNKVGSISESIYSISPLSDAFVSIGTDRRAAGEGRKAADQASGAEKA